MSKIVRVIRANGKDLYESGIKIIEELQAKKTITPDTALAHKVQLFKQVSGIDLTKVPSGKFENVTLIESQTVHVNQIETPGNLPIKGVTTVQEADLDGFFSADSIAKPLGVSSSIISKIAKGIGIHSVPDLQNTWGVIVEVMRNGKKLNDQWCYSQQAKNELTALVERYLSKRRSVPKKTPQQATIDQVVNEYVAMRVPTQVAAN